MQQAGRRVGHEEMGPDGIVSWLHVGEGTLYEGRCIEMPQYDDLWHLVRSPLNVISSQTTALRVSLEFIRNNLNILEYDELPEISDNMTGPEKVRFAARTWVAWNQKIEDMGPSFRLRVEDLIGKGQRDSRLHLYKEVLTLDKLHDWCGREVASDVLGMADAYGY